MCQNNGNNLIQIIFLHTLVIELDTTLGGRQKDNHIF